MCSIRIMYTCAPQVWYLYGSRALMCVIRVWQLREKFVVREKFLVRGNRAARKLCKTSWWGFLLIYYASSALRPQELHKFCFMLGDVEMYSLFIQYIIIWRDSISSWNAWNCCTWNCFGFLSYSFSNEGKIKRNFRVLIRCAVICFSFFTRFLFWRYKLRLSETSWKKNLFKVRTIHI